MGYLLIATAIVIATLVFSILSPYEGKPFVGFIGLLAFVCFTAFNMVYQVPAGHVGLVYRFGAIVGQTGPGLQFVSPWTSVWGATVQVQGHKFEKLESFSSETQTVYVAATLNTRVSPDHIIGLYTTVGEDYFDILVRPRVNQAFKDEIVKYRSVDVAPHREQIRETVRKRLTEELQSNSIAVDDLLLDNIWFSDQFEKAIENKQEQTQNALAEHEKVEAEHQRAQQAIEVAEGQASANAKLAASITPELIQWQAVQKLAPNVEIMMIPSGANFIMPPELLTKARRPAPAPGPGPTP